jgi:hypothetical protein
LRKKWEQLTRRQYLICARFYKKCLLVPEKEEFNG